MSLNKWEKKNNELHREIHFKNYKDSLDFIMKTGRIAEVKNHHPKIVSDYLKVDVFLHTHDENAITQKDYELAEMIEHIIEDI